MLMSDLVDKVRSRINGSFQERMNVLDADYVTGSGVVNLRYAAPELQSGALLSVGLNTFYVLNNTSDGRTLQVIDRADGSFDNNLPAGTRGFCKPRHTTWAIFRELSDQIVGMASPYSGIYQPVAFEANIDRLNGTYELPQDWQDDALQPMKLVGMRQRQMGTDKWNDVDNFVEWQPERWQVQVYGDLPMGSLLEFTFGFPFRRPQSLVDDTATLGMTEQTTTDIPTLGAAANLFLSGEGRRIQPSAQGDSRRPTEVPITSSTSVAREWRREQMEAVNAERSRLQKLFPNRLVLGV